MEWPLRKNDLMSPESGADLPDLLPIRQMVEEAVRRWRTPPGGIQTWRKIPMGATDKDQGGLTLLHQKPVHTRWTPHVTTLLADVDEAG